MRTHHVRLRLESSQLFRLQTDPHRLFLRILEGEIITPAHTEAMQSLATSLFVPRRLISLMGNRGMWLSSDRIRLEPL